MSETRPAWANFFNTTQHELVSRSKPAHLCHEAPQTASFPVGPWEALALPFQPDFSENCHPVWFLLVKLELI